MRFADYLSFLLTGKLFSPRELAAVRGEISFSAAIAAHLAWKRALVDAITQQTPPLPDADDIGTDKRCTLGEWIYGAGERRYGDLSSFADLRRHHARFHELARSIVELTRANRVNEAKLLMDGEFQDASRAIIERIRHLSALFGS